MSRWPPGANLVEVWFGDLCERDTRYYFELSLLRGQELSPSRCRCRSRRSARRRSKRCSHGMRFERPSYRRRRGGDRCCRAGRRMDFDVRVEVTGDFMSAETGARSCAACGAAKTGSCSARSRRFRPISAISTSRLQHGDFALTRMLGVEICASRGIRSRRHRSSARAEALRHVAERAEPDTVRGAGAARDRPAAAPRPTRCWRRACRRSSTATIAPTSCSCRCCGAASPSRGDRARRRAPRSTRRSSASATGWTSPATT